MGRKFNINIYIFEQAISNDFFQVQLDGITTHNGIAFTVTRYLYDERIECVRSHPVELAT